MSLLASPGTSRALLVILGGLLLAVAALTAGAPHPALPEDVDADEESP